MTSPKTSRRRTDTEEMEVEIPEEHEMEEGSLNLEGIYIPPPPRGDYTMNSKGPRLIITKIINNFFKSCAQQVQLGPFHHCFTSIVGPNGSGKSNVIDAMLFVFGYRATKIRSKKISNLIHKSENYQNVRDCTVTIHFQEILDKECGTYEVLPNTEFTVSRTAGTDSSSYYEWNNKRVQFKEVAVLLRKHGIDLDHNRFLILQGEVEQISMMKSKGTGENDTGMLEYLEDIIGTSRFIAPLGKLNEKVEVLAERRSQKLNRANLVEKELQELQGPMEEAVGYLELENTVTRDKNLKYQKEVRDLDLNSEEVTAKGEEVQIKIVEMEDKLSEIVNKKKEKEGALKETSQKYNEIEKRRDSMKVAFDKANSRDIQLQADMTQLNQTRKKNKTNLALEQKNYQVLLKVPEESAKSIEECEQKLQTLLPKKEQLDEEKTKLLASLKTETQELQKRKEVLETKLATLMKAVDETKAAYSLADSDLSLYTSAADDAQRKLSHVRTQYTALRDTLTSKTTELAALRHQLPASEAQLTEAKGQMAGVRSRLEHVTNECRGKRRGVEECRSSLTENRGRGKVLEALLKQREEGKCAGLLGRLGDLGAIDKRYDVAISTACGPLDNIVVDTVETAGWCIDFLKKYDIGRATFIALDKQEHLRNKAESKINTPENVHRLFDLVKINDRRVRTAFYYALRDTLVANDLDQATRIAYGERRFRVVTVDGGLIETTGTMSGGGKNVSRGRMGNSVKESNVSVKDVQKMEAELTKLEEEIRSLREKELELETKIDTLESNVRQMRMKIDSYTTELQSLKQQEPLFEKQIKGLETRVEQNQANPNEVKKLKDIINEKKARFDKAKEAADVFQVQVDSLTKEIKEKTTDKLKLLDNRIKEVVRSVDKLKKEITRLNVLLKTSDRNTKKSEDSIKTMEEEIKSSEETLRAMNAEITELTADAKIILAKIQELSESLEMESEGHDGMRNEVKELTKEENKLKASKIEVDHKMKEINKELHAIKYTKDKYLSKLKELKLEDIPRPPNSLQTLNSITSETTPNTTANSASSNTRREKNVPLETFTAEHLDNNVDMPALARQIHANEELLKSRRPNLAVIADYHRKREVYMEKSKELDEISTLKKRAKNAYDLVKQKRKDEFLTGYNVIRRKLKELYQMITIGGDADFEMVDSFDPFTEGIQFNVRPPKKSWKMISNLSGGEKTLSSLALVFALHHYKPSPLYVMDEIDAALDFKNVSIVAHYIKERTKNAQFLIISLRSNMFELSNYLTGIYKVTNCTQSVTIENRSYEDDLALEKEKTARSANPPIGNGEKNATNVENGEITVENAEKSVENVEKSIENAEKSVDSVNKSVKDDESKENDDESMKDVNKTTENGNKTTENRSIENDNESMNNGNNTESIAETTEITESIVNNSTQNGNNLQENLEESTNDDDSVIPDSQESMQVDIELI